MLFESVIEAVGHTPTVRLRGGAAPGVELFAKLESQNLFGMKDRVARNIILEATRTGALLKGAPIIESSSGTMALGVALVGTALGHPVHIVTDPRIDAITLAKLRALGCEVHIVRAMTGAGWQSARLELLAELQSRLPGAFWPDQYGNPDNPASYRTLADELLADLGSFDVLVASVGSGGSLCGTARCLREALPRLRVIGVDSIGSVLFGQPDRPGRLQSGLGNSLLPANLDRRLINEVHWLNDVEAFTATRDLAREQQIFAGNTSGSVYRVLKHVAADAEPGTRIVGILPDRGDRYTETIYDDSYWAEHGLDAREAAARPLAVPAGNIAESWCHTEEFDRSRDRQQLLFLESNTTGTGMLALRLARELGVTPVLYAHEPGRYQELPEADCSVITCDTNSLPELRRTIRQAHRREEIAGITTTSDFYLAATAELATWLGLPGNSADSVAVCRNKALTRARLAEAGVQQPRFAVATSVAEALDGAAYVGLPCVVKPVDDSGSNNVLLCTTAEQVQSHAGLILAQETNVRGQPMERAVLVEEYLNGPEVSVETFSWEGAVHCVGITGKRVTGEPYFVEDRHVFPAPLPPGLASDTVKMVQRAVRAVGHTQGAVHTEVRLTDAGPTVIEINARLAGGMIPELIELSTGTNLLKQQLCAALGRQPQLKFEPVRFAAIQFLLPEQEGTFARVDGVQAAEAVERVHRVSITARPGQRVRAARNAYDRLGFVIAYGDSADEAIATCAKALDELRIVLKED